MCLSEKVDPIRTSTVGLLANAITSKWRPSSSSTTVYLSIGGYRLDANDPVDILREDDVLDVMFVQVLSPVPRHVSSDQNQAPVAQQQPQQQPQQQHQSNHHSLSNRKKRLSVYHADRSGFGLDLEEEAATTQYYGGDATNGAAAGVGIEVVPRKEKRKTGEIEEDDGKRKKHKRARSQTGNHVQEETNTEEMVVPATSTNGATHEQGVTDGVAGNDASPVEKKKKRTRRYRRVSKEMGQ